MLLKVPIADGQEAYAVVPSRDGFHIQRVAVREAHYGGELIRANDADEDGEAYEDAVRHLTLGEVFDGPKGRGLSRDA